MIESTGQRPETRYGTPAADLIMHNRFYIVGYSFYFRQAKWALEIVSSNDQSIDTVERMDNFRPDLRVPVRFRTLLTDYRNSGFDRGHLVASANQRDLAIQNSETFLLSNMSTQAPQFNRRIWKDLEGEVRRLDGQEEILETYVICGPIFDFRHAVETIGNPNDGSEVSIPVPHAFFKSILTEDDRGRFDIYSFIIPNEESQEPLSSFLVPTIEVEYKAGIFLWDTLSGTAIDREKERRGRMW